MNVTWILEPDMFTPYADALISEVKSQGHIVRTVPAFYASLDWGDTSRYYIDFAPEDSCVVCHASFQFASLVAEDEIWVPGTYGICEAIDCSNYFPHFDDCLLNRDYELVTVDQLANNADALVKSYGSEDRIFVRPDSGGKTFTGRLFARHELTAKSLRSTGAQARSQLLVSSPKSIEREWRFIIADHKVVAASQYKQANEVRMSNDIPNVVMDFAVKLASRDFQPDRVWVLDICQTPAGEMCVVEINGFSSSIWYSSDLKAIVAAVSEVAIDDWQQGMAAHQVND